MLIRHCLTGKTLLAQAGSVSRYDVPMRGFYSKREGVSRDFITFLQQPIDFRLSTIIKWFQNAKYRAIVDHHKYVMERHRVLGPDLATAHFVIARGGAVKLVGQDDWVEQKNNRVPLPNVFVPEMFVEAIDASNTQMMYCSFDNFVRLNHLRYLKLRGCEYIDDWCLDRFVQFSTTLTHLDLSECPLITERGLAVLHKLKRLRHLEVYAMPAVRNQALVGTLLEEAMPLCRVEGIDYDDVADTAGEPSPYLAYLVEHAKSVSR